MLIDDDKPSDAHVAPSDAPSAFARSDAAPRCRYYQPLVRKEVDDILRVPAIVLANLCVACIMTNQNMDAEELMKRIEVTPEHDLAAPLSRTGALCYP